MAKDMHKESFTKETLLKLDLFRDCFKEWFPVFLHSPYYNELYVYDLFAGSGPKLATVPHSEFLPLKGIL